MFNKDEYQHRQFTQNACYLHKIVRVTDERGRKFTKPNTNRMYYIFDVYTQNPTTGEKFAAEYLSPGPTQNVFHESAVQWFRCVLPGKVADEIEPCEEPTNAVNTKDRFLDELPKDPIRNTQIAGTKMSIAMGFAKDIIVANVSSRGLDVGDEIKDQLCSLADEIYNWFNAKEQL